MGPGKSPPRATDPHHDRQSRSGQGPVTGERPAGAPFGAPCAASREAESTQAAQRINNKKIFFSAPSKLAKSDGKSAQISVEALVGEPATEALAHEGHLRAA